MCKLIIATKKRGPCPQLEDCISSQYSDLFGEPHGFGSLVLGRTPKTFTALPKDGYAHAFVSTLEALDTARLAIIHTRTATQGKPTAENIHVARSDRGRTIAHNGIVSGFSPKPSYQRQPFLLDTFPAFSRNKLKKNIRRLEWRMRGCGQCRPELPCTAHMNDAIELDYSLKLLKDTHTPAGEGGVQQKQPEREDVTDSFEFLRALPDELTAENIGHAIRQYGFSGVAAIHETKPSRTWLLATRPMQAHTDGKTWAAIYSFMPDTPSTKRTVSGLPMYLEDGAILKTTIAAGVYQLK